MMEPRKSGGSGESAAAADRQAISLRVAALSESGTHFWFTSGCRGSSSSSRGPISCVLQHMCFVLNGSISSRRSWPKWRAFQASRKESMLEFRGIFKCQSRDSCFLGIGCNTLPRTINSLEIVIEVPWPEGLCWHRSSTSVCPYTLYSGAHLTKNEMLRI